MEQNEGVPRFSPVIVVAAVLALAPYLCAGFCPERFTGWIRRLPPAAQVLSPALLAIPYVLVALRYGTFSWNWMGLYALLPVGIAACLRGARSAPSIHWVELLILAML